MTSTASVRRWRWLGVVATVAVSLGIAPPRAAAQRAAVVEENGTLPDGTVYAIRVPPNWNKTLIRDLDYARDVDTSRSKYLLEKGYALAGTMRHDLRAYQYDPATEVANLNLVLDRVESRFGKPARVIQYGCSGGGNVTLEVAEDFPERIDGAVAMAAHTPVWLMNTFLDGWFALKALLIDDPQAPAGRAQAATLAITGLPNDRESGAAQHGIDGPLPIAWRQAIDGAQATPQGRARIALAFTIGQWPAWVNRLTPQPDLQDVAALEHAMYHTAFQDAANPGGEARRMFENAAWGQQLSWNTGLDYRELFENGNESFKRAVRELYRQAGLDLDADLARINAFPRVAASPFALEFWKQPGRTVHGRPRIPLLRLHEIGDYQVPISLVQGYETLIRANGNDDLFRDAFVNGDGHCQFTVAESAAAIETMMRRLDTGRWGNTDPASMNTLGASLGTGTSPRFFDMTPYRQKTYNRVWVPD